MFPQKVGKNMCQIALGNQQRATDAHRARRLALQRGQALVGRAYALQRGLAVHVEAFARFGQGQAARGAMQQTYAHAALQRGHAATQA
ncbi:hypothetical protein D3C77_629540 [compost metagenome]